MYHSLFDPKNDLRVVKTTSTYPHSDNTLHVVLNVDGKPLDIHHLGKAEYELALHVRSLKLSKTELKKLVSLVESYGEQKYQEASDSAAMDHAESSL